jgi:1,4-alpha-glucan branching enzyme
MAKKNNSTSKIAFSLLAPEAKEVFLAGDFTDWEKAPLPLKKRKDGTWLKELSLPSGVYEYRFIVDGEWQNDPQALERKPNPFGTENSVCLVALDPQ